MSDSSGRPQEKVGSSLGKRTLLQKLRNAKNVALSRNYDSDVNPQDYEAYVESVAKRGNLGRVLAELTTHRVSPLKKSGDQASVLDVAAGTGIISRALAEKGYRVTATDLSQNALDYLHEKSSQIVTKQADMNEGLPFEENSFEIVTTVWGNRYMKDTDKFLQEAHRVLKPDGVLIWPIFRTESPLWKMNNGIRQHTTSISLMKDATTAGFSMVEVVNAPKTENERQRVPSHNTPRYIIAKK